VSDLRRELDALGEVAEVEAAMSEVVQAIAQSTFDLQQVLQTILERAAQLCDGDNGNVAMRDGEVYRVVAFVGMGAEYERMTRARIYRPERGSVVGRALLDLGVAHILDVTQDPDYELGDLQKAGGYRTAVAVPMIREGLAIGVIAIGRKEVRAFSAREVRLLETFGAQAAIAMQIATLFGEMREALERESAISQVLQTISRSAFDLDQVLQTVIERAVELSHADFGNILRLDEASDFYQVVAHHGEVDPRYWELVTHTPYKPDRGTLIGRTLAELRPVHIVDILEDPEYRFWQAQESGGYRTILGVPMLHDGFPIGVFVVWRRQVKPFTDREISLLATFADQAALAMGNVRLFQTVERQRSELARFAPQVASLLTDVEGQKLLAGHRREITTLFCDLRGFTAFAELAEPEEVLGVLRQYHAAVGELAVARGGSVEHFAGDGLMVFFNDPVQIDQHPVVAIRTALEMRARFGELAAGWRKRGYELDLGVGMAVGYATLGRIGFEGRYDYGGVGNVVILASRLSSAAAGGEILVSQRLFAAIEDVVDAEPIGPLELKGISRPVAAFRVLGLSPT
jgi:class 3 adenylate cyclase/putative methionine-R-sulfoxide reductase with GAF domain